jgi:hypothetical protein
MYWPALPRPSAGPPPRARRHEPGAAPPPVANGDRDQGDEWEHLWIDLGGEG